MLTALSDRICEYRAATPRAGTWNLQELHDRYLLFDDGLITVVYAPVDYVNVEARILLLGITPGLQQAQIAFKTQYAMRGASAEAAGREIKRLAAFAGMMRRNLITMLDDLGVHTLLGVRSADALFAEHAELLHSTSALRYPVFKNRKNYSGHSPEPVRHECLAWMLEHMLAPEISAVPNALIVPLGRTVEHVLDHLTARGLVREGRWLRGFPHPSGANGHRKVIFEKNREALRSAARCWLQAPQPPRY